MFAPAARLAARLAGLGTAESATGGTAYEAFDTLYTALEVLTRVAAPLLPLVTEEIWRGLTGGRSVHLTDWPSAADLPADDALVAAMDRARTNCSVGSSLRKSEQLRVRLPLVEVQPASALDPELLTRLRRVRRCPPAA